jgi:flagellin-like hook-associated protein FlgL
LKDRLSQAGDADISEVMVQLNARQMTYQEALAAAARLSDISLLKYMD